MYVQARGGGGKDGRDNCTSTRVYSGTGEVLGIDDGKEGGVESFLRPQKFEKKLQRYFIHIVKKKTTNLEVNSTNSCVWRNRAP